MAWPRAASSGTAGWNASITDGRLGPRPEGTGTIFSMIDLSAAEDAVRRYLAWVEDPSSLIDTEAVARAETAFRSATEPIAKLHAAAALERVKVGDASGLRAAFVGHARDYAAHADIPVQAFRTLGVSDDVLAEAGFALPASRGRRGPVAGGTRARADGLRVRAPQITVPQLQAAALAMPGPFTLSKLVDAAGGGSPVTARKAVEELVTDGRLAALGPDLEHTGPGRSPNRYEPR